MTLAAERDWFRALALLVMLASAVVARAQEPAAVGTETDADTDTDTEYHRAVAGALDEFQLGHFAEARALFERAHQINPNARTLRGMSFADFESQHHALALKEIEAALADPRKPLDADQRAEAEDFRARLRTLVGSVEIRVSPPDAALFVNGVAVSSSLHLDPGRYIVRASADGHVQAETTVQVEAGRQSDVELALVPIAREAATTGLGTQRTAALVAGGVGAVAVIVGSIFGVRSIVKHDESDEFCSGDGACRDARGVDAMEQARTAGDIATVAWVIGGLGLAGGAVLWFAVPESERASATAKRTRIGVGVATLQLETRW